MLKLIRKTPIKMSEIEKAIDYVIGTDENIYHPIELLPDGINFVEDLETQEIGFLPFSEVLNIILKPDGLIIIQSLQAELERLREENEYLVEVLHDEGFNGTKIREKWRTLNQSK